MVLVRSKFQQVCTENGIGDAKVFLNSIGNLVGKVDGADILYERLRELNTEMINIPRGISKESLIYSIGMYYDTCEIYPLDIVYEALLIDSKNSDNSDKNRMLDEIYNIYCNKYEYFIECLSRFEIMPHNNSNLERKHTDALNTNIQVPNLIQQEKRHALFDE